MEDWVRVCNKNTCIVECDALESACYVKCEIVRKNIDIMVSIRDLMYKEMKLLMHVEKMYEKLFLTRLSALFNWKMPLLIRRWLKDDNRKCSCILGVMHSLNSRLSLIIPLFGLRTRVMIQCTFAIVSKFKWNIRIFRASGPNYGKINLELDNTLRKFIISASWMIHLCILRVYISLKYTEFLNIFKWRTLT